MPQRPRVRSPFLVLLLFLLLLVPRATTSLLLCTGISMPVRVECLVAMGSSDRPSDVIVRNRGTVRRLPRILRSAVTLPFSLSLSLSLSLSQRTTLHYPHQPTTNQSTTCYATGQLSLSLSPRLCGVKLALSRLLEFVSLSLRFNGARSFISLRIPYPSIVYISIDVPFLLLYLCMYMYVIMHPVPNVRCCDHSKFATTARGRLHTSEGACASLLFVSFRCRCRCHHGRRRLAAAIALDSSSPSSISLSLSLSLSRLFYVAICMYVSRLRHVGCLTDERRRYQVNLLSTSKRFAVVATDTLACVKAASIYNVDHHRSSTTTPAPAAWWLRQRANSLRSLMMLTIDTSALTHSSRTCSLSHSMLSEPPRKTTKKHTLGDTGTTQLAHADH